MLRRFSSFLFLIVPSFCDSSLKRLVDVPSARDIVQKDFDRSDNTALTRAHHSTLVSILIDVFQFDFENESAVSGNHRWRTLRAVPAKQLLFIMISFTFLFR